MSNFAPTVGRPVQYIDNAGNTVAAIVTRVNAGSVDLAVFPPDNDNYKVSNVVEYQSNFDSRKAAQVGSYRNNWHGR